MREHSIEIQASDGRKLSGLIVEPKRPRQALLVSPATGVKKEYYLRLAREGAALGVAVLLYDYRGQGKSAGADVKKDLVDFQDWGRLDLPAAIACLHSLYPELEMSAVGHSAGAWIVGLAHNQARISRHAFVCAGWCYWRLKPSWFSAFELSLWHVYGPACVALLGYVPRGGPWRGEPLNPRLFETWKKWCHSSRCDASVLAGGEGEGHFFDRVTAPIRSFGYSDDPIANERSIPQLLSCYPNAKSDVVVKRPEDFSLARIGHDGVFRSRAVRARAPIWEWLLSSSVASSARSNAAAGQREPALV